MQPEPLERHQAFDGKRVLITGGLGFIGSNLERELVSTGASVTLVDSLIPEYGGNRFNIADLEGRVTVNVSDVRDPHSIRHLVEGVDVLFNLAGQTSHLDSMTNPQADLAINVGAQLSILEACRQVNPDVRIVFASTRQIYGRPDYLPVDETHPIRPVDVNGIHKVAGEWHHLLYERVYGLRTSALRLTNTYGPGMRVKDARQTFLGVWIRDALTGRAVRVFGDGKQLRDFNYVDDVVEALLLAATREEAVGKAYNLGSPEVISLGDLAAKLNGIVPGATHELVPFPEDRKAIDIGDYYADHSLIERELGWTPRVDLSAGLRRTIDFYRDHGPHYGIGSGQ
jgi:dTDP-glucose 4,6-dehydratase/UDP-glucose 4-epimerase